MASTSETQAPTAPPLLQRAQTAGTRSCFICLQTDAETPTQPFVNPCPCTLEAHESCLLTWITETEKSRRTPQCPACRETITVETPFDAVVALRDGLHRGFARVSPYVLLALVVGGGAVGSGWYGLLSAHQFAGPEATATWLGLQSLVGRSGRDGPLLKWVPFWRFTVRTWMLGAVGPTLLIWKAFSGMEYLFSVPMSLMSAAVLVGKDDMPQWPPSPAWAATLFPFVCMTYNNLYFDFFGQTERRLNRALRGRPAMEEPQEPRQEEGAAPPGGEQQDQGQGQNHDHQHGEDHDDDMSLWAAVRNLAQAAGAIIREPGGAVELAADIRAGDAGVQLEIEVDADEVEEILEILGDAAEVIEQEDGQEGEEHEEDLAGDEAADAAPGNEAPVPAPAPAPAPGQPDIRAIPAPNNNAAPAVPLGNVASATIGGIVSGIALTLLHPTICFGMGEILRLALPSAWVTPRSWGRAPRGLFQQQWGRSLVGGCVYVVLRDAFKLYSKYRMVEVRRHRRVKNVERRAGNASR